MLPLLVLQRGIGRGLRRAGGAVFMLRARLVGGAHAAPAPLGQQAVDVSHGQLHAPGAFGGVGDELLGRGFRPAFVEAKILHLGAAVGAAFVQHGGHLGGEPAHALNIGLGFVGAEQLHRRPAGEHALQILEAVLVLAAALNRRQPHRLRLEALLQPPGVPLLLVRGGRAALSVQLALGGLRALEHGRVAPAAGFQNGVQIGEGRVARLGGLGAGGENLLRGKAPFVQPFRRQPHLVHRRRAGDAQLSEHRRGRLFGLTVEEDRLLHVLQRARAALGPAPGHLVGLLEDPRGRRRFRTGFLHLKFHQPQRRVLGVAVDVEPVVGHGVLLRPQQVFRAEQGLKRRVEVAQLVVVRLHGIARRRAVHAQKLIGGRPVGQAADQSLTLPVGHGVVHALLVHAQRPGHVRDVLAQLRVQRQHARVEIHAQEALRRAGQVFQQKHVFDGRDVVHPRALGKAAKRHGKNLFFGG